jgi:hypothetical protein
VKAEPGLIPVGLLLILPPDNDVRRAQKVTDGTDKRAPIWPLVVAPFACLLYYILLRTAFIQSIEGTFGEARISEGVNDIISQPLWSTHWFYRGAAEYISITVAVFVAGGLARGRARAGAILGASAISIFYILSVGYLLYDWKYVDPDAWTLADPWYQYVINGILIFAAPAIAFSTAEYIEEAHRNEPGLAGINRWHFLWLWIPTYFYAMGMIGPLTRFYEVQAGGSILALAMVILVHAVPTLIVAVPLYYGLLILRGDHGSTMPSAARNFVGALVLIGGLVVGGAVQFGWYWMFNKIGEAISG